MSKTGGFVIPWGRWGELPEDIRKSIDAGQAKKFERWCEEEVGRYLA
jgi:hypothetical protein